METKYMCRLTNRRRNEPIFRVTTFILLVGGCLLVFLTNTHGQSTLQYDSNGNLANVTAAASGPPIITAQPSSQGADNGDNVSFSVVASGSGQLTYQWFQNGVLIPGATTATLFLPNVTVSNQSYTVTVCNSYGCVTSTVPALLEMNWTWVATVPGDWYNPSNWNPAHVPTGPANITIAAGASISLSAAVTITG